MSTVEPPASPFSAGEAKHHARQDVLGARNGPGAWCSYLWVRVAVAVLTRLPRRLRDGVLTVLGELARRIDRRHSEPARSFLHAALGEDLDPQRREALVRGSFRHLASVTLDSQLFERRIPVEKLNEHFKLEACEEARALLAGDTRGHFMFVTCHVGNWEAISYWLPRRGHIPTYAIAKPPKNRPLSRWIQRVRERRGLNLLSRYGAMDDMTRIIRDGAAVGFLLDHRATSRPVVAPLFGKPALCERVSGVLFRRAKKPVILAACYETGRPFHYRLVAPRVFQPEELSSWSPEEVATRVNAELEKLILAAPDQYHWLHDRYRGVERVMAGRGQHRKRKRGGGVAGA